MFNCEILKTKLEKSFPSSEIAVIDLRNDNKHFRVKIKSKQFNGKTLIEQHRIVYKALDKELKAGLHSISLKTLKDE